MLPMLSRAYLHLIEGKRMLPSVKSKCRAVDGVAVSPHDDYAVAAVVVPSLRINGGRQPATSLRCEFCRPRAGGKIGPSSKSQ
jgi:hypothetical protein